MTLRVEGQEAAEEVVWAIVTGLEAQSHEGSAALASLMVTHGVGRLARALLVGQDLLESE
jgi:hypothetical protein